MHTIELTDDVYNHAKLRAGEAGYARVDDYVADILALSQSDDAGYEYVFTPQQIAELEKISGEIKSGAKTYSPEEVDEHFRKKFEAWPNNPVR